jgi:hypothetical protein
LAAASLPQTLCGNGSGNLIAYPETGIRMVAKIFN